MVALFCIAKRTILRCKTHHFALQNWHFWNAKLALLERKTHRFRNHPHLLWDANSIQLDFWKYIIHSSSATYLSIELLRLCFLLLPLGRPGGAFVLLPLGRLGGCFARVLSTFLIFMRCNLLEINVLNKFFVLTHYFDVSFTSAHSIWKSGSDRKCINMHFNNLRLFFFEKLTNIFNLDNMGIVHKSLSFFLNMKCFVFVARVQSMPQKYD